MNLRPVLAAPLAALLALAACGGGGSDAPPPPAPRISGTVGGLTGEGLVLRLGALDLPIASDGPFSFGEVAAGSAYAVTVAAQPSCPGQTCTVSGGAGTAPATGDTAITVTCAANATRLVTSSWNDSSDVANNKSLRITDGLQALANGATATPRIVRGPATLLRATPNSLGSTDNLAVDPVRDLVYVADHRGHAIRVFSGLATLAGDVAPARTIDLAVGDPDEEPMALALDVARDRLYVALSRLTGEGFAYVLRVYAPASGAAAPVAETTLPGITAEPWALDHDRATDRLWVARFHDRILERYDGVSTLANGAAPARTITLTALRPAAIAIDACTDRLYVGSHSPAGLVALSGASALATGTLDETAAAAATIGGSSQAIALDLDDQDRLHVLEDSATRVRTYSSASTLSGPVAAGTARSVSGVVANGYGIDSQPVP